MGSKGAKLAESERGVWFWLKIHGTCTPHFKRKYERILFRGRETDSAPKFWSPAFDNDVGVVPTMGAEALAQALAVGVVRPGKPAVQQAGRE